MYFAISGAGGIGKTTSLAWLADQFAPYLPVVTLPDYTDPPDMNWPIEGIVTYLAHQKLIRDAAIREYISDGTIVFCDRTCLDPLSLAMTLLSEDRWRILERWYNTKNFTYGHHILLKAPHSVIRDRRLRRGSSPRTTWLKNFAISQDQYESSAVKHWLYIHEVLGIPFYTVDFSSHDKQENLQRLLVIINNLINLSNLSQTNSNRDISI